MGDEIVFLMYHEIEEPGRSTRQAQAGYLRYVVRHADFRSQMELLREKGWRGVSMGEAITFRCGKAVAITFDDGSETDLLCAAPELRRCGFAATFYVTSNWLGQPGHLSDAQLRELSAMGFEIGCHSMTHAYLNDLDAAGLDRELVQAKLQIEQVIGRRVEHFSCPGGRIDDRVAQLAKKAGYKTVATSRVQANSRYTDRFRLGRVAIMRSTSLLQFEKVCTGQGFWRTRIGLRFRESGRKVLGNGLYDRLRSSLLREKASPVDTL